MNLLHLLSGGSMYKNPILRFVLVAVTLLLTPCIHAQENATVTGTVFDPTGAAVPSAQITLTNIATGQSRNTNSNESGIYSFPNAGIGEFTLTVTASGFQKYIKSGMVVNVAQTLRADVNLTV